MKKKISLIIAFCLIFSLTFSTPAFASISRVDDYSGIMYNYGPLYTLDRFWIVTGYCYMTLQYKNNGIDTLYISLVDSSDNVVQTRTISPGNSGSTSIQFGGGIPNKTGYRIKFSAVAGGSGTSISLSGSIYDGR